MSRIRGILNMLGRPQDAYRIIHIAGTNGKGSSCAMISSILRAAGFRTGVFTSPHLETFNERISVDGVCIDDEAFAGIAGQIRECERFLAESEGGLSFFEILTLMGLLYFARKHVEYAVIEVGIGGRLDATNAPEHTFLSVITSISHDHCDILGNTLEEIAAEKAGIIKKKNVTVLYLTTEKVYNRIQEICGEMSAKLYYFDKRLFVNNIQYDLTKTIFSVVCDYFSYKDLTLSLLGQYQVFNACHVLLCVHALRETGVLIDDRAVREGLVNAHWPGRMEVIGVRPLIFIDGAHNVDGGRAFCRSVEIYRNGKRHIVVVGMLKTKDAAGFMEVISQSADLFIFTRPDSYKALEAEALAAFADKNKPLIIEPDCRKAVSTALAIADLNTVISVVGSLYLIGDVRKYFAEVRK
ncbi:MAG: bifunctional folylpolyglutamate synthase/dihydrofolate synthase [Clostridiales bacterium]|nr:bifunctional folylpolyglutamate synthase/dihydrofolate synthase [Clostridiales bacterium]